MRILKSAIFGTAYGVASPIPGFDGGTFFILFNAYEGFINGASLKNIREKLPTVLPFVIGCAVGLFGVSRLMLLLIENYVLQTYASFAGLIIGCIPMIYKKSFFYKFKKSKATLNIIIFLIALALILLYVLYNTDTYIQDDYFPPGISHIWIFFASAISAVGMLIPGVGGALIMLVLGIYDTYLEALANFDWPVILLLVGGMVTGILSGLRFVRKILNTYPKEMYSAILGFTIGSVFIVWPGFNIFAVIFAIGFAFLAYKLSNSDF